MNALARTAALAALLAATATAAGPPPPLPPDLAETLRSLPPDVDALVVASDFKLADARGTLARVEDPLPAFLRGLATSRALGDPDDPESTLPAAPLWRTFGERQVDFAALAAREVFPASAFGFCGYAACHVIRFADALGPAANQVAAELRTSAADVFKIGNREVAAFNWGVPKEPYIKTRSWEGLFILLPQPDDRELFVATQRRLLEEILERRANPAVQRQALPPDLPAWRFVDTSAAVWAMLAAPPRANRQSTDARDVITFEYHADGDARFVFRAPSASLPADPGKIDPYDNAVRTPARYLLHLDKSDVAFKLERPSGEPARLTVPLAGADRQAAAKAQVTLVFSTGALLQHCIPPH